MSKFKINPELKKIVDEKEYSFMQKNKPGVNIDGFTLVDYQFASKDKKLFAVCVKEVSECLNSKVLQKSKNI